MTNWGQRSFAAGEVAEALWGRSDLSRYAIGLRRLRNFRGLRAGGVETRPGTQYVDETRFPAKKSVVRPFVKNASIGDSYAMEFGDLYAEFIRAGQRVTEAARNITGITQANPAVVTSNAHGYSNGDDILVANVVGMIQVNGRRFRVAGVTANTFQLQYVDGTNVNSTGFAAYTSGGTASRVYKIATPYTEAQVEEIQYDTLNDVAVIVHRSHAPRKLTRSGHASWLLEGIQFNPGTNFPAGIQGAGTAGTTTQLYKVTAISADGVESLPGVNNAPLTITGITKSTAPVVTTSAAHGLQTGDEVLISTNAGMVELNVRRFIILVLTATTFNLLNVDTTSYSNFTAGEALPTFSRVPNIVAPSTANPITVTHTGGVAGAVKYAFYREVAGSFGFIGYSTGVSFVDTGYTAQSGDNPPAYSDRFKDVSGFPGTVCFNQGRLVFGSTDAEPIICIASRSNDFYNLTTHDSPIDSDAIEWAVAVKGSNQVRHLVPNRRLVALCDSAIVVIEGDRDGILTPFSQNANAYGAEGSSFVRPVVVGGRIILVQARGSVLLDFGYDLEGDYAPFELSNSASHLFDRYAIRDMDAQLAPHPTIWCVRSDGKLIGLTYVRAEEFRSFHWHDTDGSFESVAVVPELAEGVGDDDIDENDAVYFVVKRTVNGATRRYVERLHSRRYTDLRDAVFADSAKTTDGRHTGSTTATLTGGATWAYTEILTLTFSGSQSISVNDVIHLEGADGAKVRFRILGGSGAIYTGRATKTVPTSLRGVATTSWGHAKSVFTGLWHLEGKSVSVLGDGNVCASPNRGTGLTVTNGAITLPNDGNGLPQTAVVVHVGLPYLSDFETLNPETPEGMSMAGKQKIVKGVLLNVFESRGLHVGPKEPSAATPLKNLDDVKLEPATIPDEVPALVTKIHRVPILGEWAEHGRVFVRQVDPLPLTILAVTSEGEIAR